MKPVRLYPPGGGQPVRAHPGEAPGMIARGWSTKPPAKSEKPKEDKTR